MALLLLVALGAHASPWSVGSGLAVGDRLQPGLDAPVLDALPVMCRRELDASWALQAEVDWVQLLSTARLTSSSRLGVDLLGVWRPSAGPLPAPTVGLELGRDAVVVDGALTRRGWTAASPRVTLPQGRVF